MSDLSIIIGFGATVGAALFVVNFVYSFKLNRLEARVRKLEKLTELMDDANARVEEARKLQGVRQ